MSQKISPTNRPVILPVIYLASRSPRRVELLKQIGLDCQVLPADIDETQLKNEPPESYVVRLARQKAEACFQRLSPIERHHPILAADTTVVLAGQVLNKPLDAKDAHRMLRALSGTVHEVHTAVALAFAGSIDVALSTTKVEMMPLTDAQIAAYIASGEYQDKAGSYGIQGWAGTWIKRIEGSYSGVMGLPLYETAELLTKHGIKAF